MGKGKVSKTLLFMTAFMFVLSSGAMAEERDPLKARVPTAKRSAAKKMKNPVPFTKENVGESLATRQLLKQLREQGVMGGGPPPFAKKDRSAFLQKLDEMVNAIRREAG